MVMFCGLAAWVVGDEKMREKQRFGKNEFGYYIHILSQLDI